MIFKLLIFHVFSESGEVQRIVGFKAGDRIGNLCMEPRHVLVEKYFRYWTCRSFVCNNLSFVILGRPPKQGRTMQPVQRIGSGMAFEWMLN